MTRAHRGAIALAIAALVTGCALSTLEPKVDSLSVKDVVDLQMIGDPAVLVVHRDSFATFVAHVPANSTVHTVAFATSAGVFILTGKDNATVRLETDAADPERRPAGRIQLRRTDTLSAFAIVSAIIGDFRDTVRIRFK